MIDKIIKVLFLAFLIFAGYTLVSTERGAPVITIDNQLSKTFLMGTSEPTWSTYFTVEDDKDGILLPNEYTIDTSEVDFDERGKQDIIVSATDSDGNSSEETMTIKINSAYKHTSFENISEGIAFVRELWEQEGLTTGDWDNGLEERTKITYDESATGNSALEVIYPKGQFGSEETGVQVEIELKPSKEYYASYKVKFDDGFSWGSENLGGKLPGLTGGDKCGDDFVCDGTDGFSARFMWRDEGYPELYLYSADMENDAYGDDIDFMSNGERFQFETGKWYTITEHVEMNSTPYSDDGVVEVWVDGEQMIDLDDITFVTDQQKIDTFYFSTFHGGHDESWAPTVTSKAYFDDIKISIDPEEVDFE